MEADSQFYTISFKAGCQHGVGNTIYVEPKNSISLKLFFLNISDHFIMKIGSFPENFSFVSQVVWEKIGSNILSVFIRQNSRLPGEGGTK